VGLSFIDVDEEEEGTFGGISMMDFGREEKEGIGLWRVRRFRFKDIDSGEPSVKGLRESRLTRVSTASESNAGDENRPESIDSEDLSCSGLIESRLVTRASFTALGFFTGDEDRDEDTDSAMLSCSGLRELGLVTGASSASSNLTADDEDRYEGTDSIEPNRIGLRESGLVV